MGIGFAPAGRRKNIRNTAALRITLEQLDDLGLGESSGYARALLAESGATSWSVSDARAAGCSLEDVLWVMEHLKGQGCGLDRRYHLWGADCAAHVLPIFEAAHPGDWRPRNAIDAVREFAAGRIGRKSLSAFQRQAWRAACAALLSMSAGDASASWAAGLSPIWAAEWAARAAKRAAGTVDAWHEEREWQFERLCAWMSEEPPTPWPTDRIGASGPAEIYKSAIYEIS